MRRKYGESAVIALLSVLVLFLQSLFTGSAVIRIPFVFAGLFALILVARVLEERLSPQIMPVLRRLFNSCAREGSRITTVSEFLVQTDEEGLKRGDEVHVLTNSLFGYDMTPPAVQVIANNLLEGVRYIYYLPCGREYPNIANEKDSFVKLVSDECHLSGNEINSYLRFLLIEEDCLFNFAVVRRTAAGTADAYWYITTPAQSPPADSEPLESGPLSPQSEASPSFKNPWLIILKLHGPLADELLNVFLFLGKSKTALATSPGLRPE